ncbi:Leo1, Paf1 RNA polymerase II complex component [Nesidiocoris tenuis]|uniref:Leo1, Paf1 RNA polymerase II complex component n=1 Tax=Nesidiocoris tenuis TaxID=355587 RepID=A0ABN7AEA3_9HEMI|nr:Leo1, Paf1 RNA polymerase II complex component [Nesidiocoris tenuis]
MGSTTVSLSILAGITFGFLYLLISGIKWASERLEGGAGIVGRDRCGRCGVTFADVEDGSCSMCGVSVCTHCAIHYQHSWLCSSCVIKTDESLNTSDWVLSHFKKRFQSTVAVMRKYGKKESDIRDFVEKLTEHLIGGRLDNVRIDRVCSHPNYMKFMDKYEQVLSLTLSRLTSSIQMLLDGIQDEKSAPPKAVHQQLKALINEIIEEANNLDLTYDETEKIKELRSKTYEDILAIAVLNKASEKVLQPVANSCYENLDLINGNKGLSIPELESEFEDIVKETGYYDWNDNWHLEKKQESSSSSVTMLIPSPNEITKPKIGDVEVDELSDLSDVEVEERVQDIEDAYQPHQRESQRSSPAARMNGYAGSDSEDVAAEEYLHYREPAIPSIVEARNNVFKSLGNNSGDETDFQRDRDVGDLTHKNSTRVKIIEQAYTDRFQNGWRDSDVSRVSVRHLAKNFSLDDAPPLKYSVISDTQKTRGRGGGHFLLRTSLNK